MHSHRVRRGAAALLVVLSLVGAACSRGEDDTETGGATTVPGGASDTTAADGGEEPTGGLDAGGFGDLEDVCQEGDASGATDVGVTDETIQVGTITDKGFTARPGLNEEMYDAAVAFANWCNEHGGINGRELVVADRDAALTDFTGQITTACAEDFALVGGGAVLDDSDNGARVACGLPNIAGYVVSETARTADLQIQPVPNPAGTLQFGVHQLVAEQFPDLINRFGTLTSSFGSVLNQRDDTEFAAGEIGYTTVYSEEYNSQGESNWQPFVEGMRAADVQVFEMIGEPTFFSQVLEAMDRVGYRPQIIIQGANFYDANFAATAGDIAQNVHVRTSFTPFELADENQATADYLEMIDRYNPGGKTALLGMQAMSSYLFFAQAASACGSELTRACLIEQGNLITEWTAGGLHAPTNPAENIPAICFLSLDVTADGFVVNEEFTGATDGTFNCEDDNVVDVPTA